MSPCSICGRLSASMLKTSLGEWICDRHPHRRNCFFCLRSFDDHGSRSCRTCTGRAVDRSELAAINTRVLQWLGRFFPHHSLGATSVSTVAPEHFDEWGRGLSTVSFDGSTATADIVVPNDSPPFAIAESLAHEYGHILLALDPISFKFLGLPRLSTEEQEGFCEVLRAQWVKELAPSDFDVRMQSIEANLITVYRTGYERVAARFAQIGSVSALRDQLLSGTGTAPDAGPSERSAMVAPPRATSAPERPQIVLSHQTPPNADAQPRQRMGRSRPTINLG